MTNLKSNKVWLKKVRHGETLTKVLTLTDICGKISKEHKHWLRRRFEFRSRSVGNQHLRRCPRTHRAEADRLFCSASDRASTPTINTQRKMKNEETKMRRTFSTDRHQKHSAFVRAPQSCSTEDHFLTASSRPPRLYYHFDCVHNSHCYWNCNRSAPAKHN